MRSSATENRETHSSVATRIHRAQRAIIAHIHNTLILMPDVHQKMECVNALVGAPWLKSENKNKKRRSDDFQGQFHTQQQHANHAPATAHRTLNDLVFSVWSRIECTLDCYSSFNTILIVIHSICVQPQIA